VIVENLETSETKPKVYQIWDVAIYAFSIIAVVTFMSHFWFIDTQSFSSTNEDPLRFMYVLWGISGAFAVLSIYGGIVRRSEITDDPTKRGMATAAAVVGCLVLLGLAVSATFLIVPLHLNQAITTVG
jgi:hypothetical protein